VKNVFISALAKKENEENVDYLNREFGMLSALEYIDNYEEAILLIEKELYSGIYDERLGLYKFLVVKQIYLLYDILEDGNALIVSAWNNKRFPYWF